MGHMRAEKGTFNVRLHVSHNAIIAAEMISPTAEVPGTPIMIVHRRITMEAGIR